MTPGNQDKRDSLPFVGTLFACREVATAEFLAETKRHD
jgi:hypothetical protein